MNAPKWKYQCHFNYQQILQPIPGIPLAYVGKLPFVGKSPLRAIYQKMAIYL
jgi:hypothetical protein